ncbi:glycoside hydrolase family 3 N-terminal domain-containing protein [Streptomyces sp. NPDC006482]|uniref:glycoside hydrolase family 3 protein n=1 Tax=Streptomyces sp. NPDC006482 TaxID=3154306 RepID=UPI0033BD775D
MDAPKPPTVWPRIWSAVPADPEIEREVADILGQLTLEEKVGQMIQPELAELTPDDVRDFKIGSALNGAGIWPGGERHASVQAWVDTVDLYWQAAEDAYKDRPFRIPFLWATDAVHGHNNVYGATVFPHNIGLGAAGDPELMRRIGEATAREVAATGMDWIFAPTVTTPRDRRWGRYYEGYGEDPALVRAYGRTMVEGLQGDVAALRTDERVLATLKHWIADGGTADGADRGTAHCEEEVLRDIHAQGFLSGIEAGAQSVMVSFSSWEHPANYDHTPGRAEPYNHKVHGSRYLLTDVLKDSVGFDGIVISDWDAHSEVAGCAAGDAGYAINAGLDVLMIAGSTAWQTAHRTTVEQVRTGVIPLSRIDDAVTRILRVKLRAGLWDKPRPRERPLVTADVVGCAPHRALSREAARKSLVLLRNSPGLLPLPRTARTLVVGSGADDLRKQCGGWTLTWQGDDIRTEDLPGGATVADAVRSVVGSERCTVDPGLEHADPRAHDVAIVAIGEDSYAEMRGTLKPWRSLAYADLKRSYASDLELLRRLRAAGVRTVTVFLGGRPLYCTEEINLSDAFVAAWLPGPHGEGITDVLFAAPEGGVAHDFQGRLPASWPRTRDASAVNRIPPELPGYRVPAEETAPEGRFTPLFPVGHGLSVHDEPPTDPLPVDDSEDTTPPPAVSESLHVLDAEAGDGTYRLRVGGHNTWSREDVSLVEPMECLIVHAAPVSAPGGTAGLTVRFKGFPAFLYAEAVSGVPSDLRGYVSAGAAIGLDVRVGERPSAPVYLACHDDYPAQPGLDLTPWLTGAGTGEWTRLSVPLADLLAVGMDLRHVDVPFMLYTEGTAVLDIGNIGWLLPG